MKTTLRLIVLTIAFFSATSLIVSKKAFRNGHKVDLEGADDISKYQEYMNNEETLVSKVTERDAGNEKCCHYEGPYDKDVEECEKLLGLKFPEELHNIIDCEDYETDDACSEAYAKAEEAFDEEAYDKANEDWIQRCRITLEGIGDENCLDTRSSRATRAHTVVSLSGAGVEGAEEFIEENKKDVEEYTADLKKCCKNFCQYQVKSTKAGKALPKELIGLGGCNCASLH